MNDNNLALFRLLNAHLNQMPPDLTDITFDREALLRLARLHDVTAIVCSQLKSLSANIQPESKNEFIQAFSITVMRSTRIFEVQKTLDELFAEASINHLYFKGPEIARYYPVPEFRTMGDIDVLVRTEDREKAVAILMAHGATEVESSIAVSEYIFCGAAVELHTNMIHEEVETGFGFQDYFAAAWDYAAITEQPFVWQLEATFHLIYVIAHLAKHFHDRGSGVRMFMDVAVLLEKQKDMLDFERMMFQLKKMRLDRFFKRVLYLNRCWFGKSSTLSEEGISEEVFETITEYVVTGGVFGYEATPLENVALRKLYHENRSESVQNAATKLLLRTVFPNNRQLEKMEYVPSLFNRKMLLPFAWLYRWFHSLLTRSKYTKNRFRQLTNISEEKVQQIIKQERIIQDMGL